MKAFPTFVRLTPILGLVLVLIALGMSTGAQTAISFNAELLNNAGFEAAGGGNANADSWTRYNADNDRRVCDQTNLVNVHTGVCAFRFVGMAGRTTTLTQVIKPAVGAAGDSLVLSAFVRAKKLTAQTAVLRIKVVYVDGGKDKVVIRLSGGSYPYQAVSTGLNLTGEVKKLRVQVVMNGGSGRFFVDDVSLMLTPAPEATATNSPTNTKTATATATFTETPMATDTKTPTNTPTHTSTPTITSTPTDTATPTNTATPL